MLTSGSYCLLRYRARLTESMSWWKALRRTTELNSSVGNTKAVVSAKTAYRVAVGAGSPDWKETLLYSQILCPMLACNTVTSHETKVKQLSYR